MRIKLILFLFLGFSTLHAQDAQELFKQANQLYSNEAYKDAETIYHKILDQGKYSTELYFNLGNTYYKLREIIPAVYYYEMALKLSPNDPEIKTNLSIATNQLVDAVKPIQPSSIAKLWNTFLQILSPFGWSWLSIICSVCSAIAFIAYLLLQNLSMKKISFTVFLIFLVSSVMSFYLTQYLYDTEDTKQEAIVFTDEFWVKEEPILESKNIFQIHGGTKVKVKERVHNWVKIVLQNGQNGWVDYQILQQIKPPNIQ